MTGQRQPVTSPLRTAGTPWIRECAGKDLVTTAPAATTQSSPMVTPFNIFTPVPIQTRSPMQTGALLGATEPSGRMSEWKSQSRMSTCQDIAQSDPILTSTMALIRVFGWMSVLSPIARTAPGPTEMPQRLPMETFRPSVSLPVLAMLRETPGAKNARRRGSSRRRAAPRIARTSFLNLSRIPMEPHLAQQRACATVQPKIAHAPTPPHRPMIERTS